MFVLLKYTSDLIVYSVGINLEGRDSDKCRRTGIRSPDRAARSELVYWLSYPAPRYWRGKTKVRGENIDPVPIFLPQKSRGLTWKSKWDSTVEGRRSTAGTWHCVCEVTTTLRLVFRYEGESNENLKYFLSRNILNTKGIQWLHLSM